MKTRAAILRPIEASLDAVDSNSRLLYEGNNCRHAVISYSYTLLNGVYHVLRGNATLLRACSKFFRRWITLLIWYNRLLKGCMVLLRGCITLLRKCMKLLNRCITLSAWCITYWGKNLVVEEKYHFIYKWEVANGSFPAELFPAGIFPARIFSRRNFHARAFSRVNYCVNYDKKRLFNANLITFFQKSFLKIS